MQYYPLVLNVGVELQVTFHVAHELVASRVEALGSLG